MSVLPRPSLPCERAREWASLRLDGELSQFESAMLESHLARCAACQAVVSETEAISEGFYAFDPAALGPACGTVSLELYSEKAPQKADTRPVPPATLQQVWRDVGLQ